MPGNYNPAVRLIAAWKLHSRRAASAKKGRFAMAITEREQRGLAIAALCRLQKNRDGVWVVPSQSSAKEKYQVRIDENGDTCTCPDYDLRKGTCKHIYAVRYT